MKWKARETPARKYITLDGEEKLAGKVPYIRVELRIPPLPSPPSSITAIYLTVECRSPCKCIYGRDVTSRILTRRFAIYPKSASRANHPARGRNSLCSGILLFHDPSFNLSTDTRGLLLLLSSRLKKGNWNCVSNNLRNFLRNYPSNAWDNIGEIFDF